MVGVSFVYWEKTLPGGATYFAATIQETVMKPASNRLFILLVLLLVALPCAAADGVEATTAPTDVSPYLTDAERDHIVELLEDSRSQLESLAAEATGDLWTHKPTDDKWSAGEVVEHLVLAEEMFLGMIDDMLQGEADPEWQTIAQGGTQSIETGLQDRSQKFQAPERLQPSGEVSRQELLERFAKGRTMLLDLARSTEAPVKKYTQAGPPGNLNVQQWLTLAGAHTLRHCEQIREVLDASTK